MANTKQLKLYDTRALASEYRDILAYIERDERDIINYRKDLQKISNELKVRGAKVPTTPANIYRD